jgi:hypothetical protein
LYRRLILDNQTSSKSFEAKLEEAGGTLITGTVGEFSTSPNGDVHIWLRHSAHGELVGRFRVPAADSTRAARLVTAGATTELVCLGVYRSYAQVSARSCVP